METSPRNRLIMKKAAITLAVMAIGSLSVLAEGYQVNTLSAKQNGMGHTGTALKLGAESQFFNPAGMAFMDGNIEVEGSFSPIFSSVTATDLSSGNKYSTDSKAATPLSISASFSILDNLKAGISFYTPYGSCINWTENWPGAVFSQSVNLKMFTVQPTIAWRVTPKLSIGAGLMIAWGNVDLNKGLVSAESFHTLVKYMGLMGAVPADLQLPGLTPASVNLTGSAHPRFGVNVGVMYDINEQWTVGANYRTEMIMKVKAGQANVSYAYNENAELAPIMSQIKNMTNDVNNAEFKAQMPCAAIFNIGVSYKPVKEWVVAFDAQLTQWNAYKTLDIEFKDLPQFDQHIEKNYRNSWTFHLGAQYSVSDRFDARAGLMIDTTPVKKDFYNPETPGMTKIEPSIGLSFRPIKQMSIDLGFLYVAGLGCKNRSVTAPDMLAPTINTIIAGINAIQGTQIPSVASTTTFNANYSLHAFCPSIGLSFNF